MLKAGLNSPVTTSAGRLFDAVASLLGVAQRSTFEGQAAMRLEWLADETEKSAWEFTFEESGLVASGAGAAGNSRSAGEPVFPSKILLDWSPIVEALLVERASGVSVSRLSAKFHNSLVGAIVEVARRVGCPRVALSGGCFQNRLLTEGAAAGLRAAGFEVLLHRQVPPNDGGIALGQAAVASARLKHLHRGGARG